MWWRQQTQYRALPWISSCTTLAHVHTSRANRPLLSFSYHTACLVTNDTAQDHLARMISAWEPHIHAFAAMCTDASWKQPHDLGSLSGLTVGVKDIIDVAGMATRNGSDACQDVPAATHDADVVAALRRAGARIVGKTSTTEFAFTDPTACRNPHDVRRTPGGSSSGSGAAVAAGLVDIALGTQTAGSLCRPAAYCGVVGFKPTYGTLSTKGVTPLAPSFDSVGIMARSVATVQRAFDAMVPPVDRHQTDASPTAICGFWNSDVVPSAPALAALTEAAGTFDCVPVTKLPTDVKPIVAAHRTVMGAEAAAAHGAMLLDERAARLKPKFLAGLRAGAAVSAAETAQAKAILVAARDAFWAEHADVDLIVTLPVPDGAPLIDGTTGYQDWLTPWTVFGGPLICLPWGLDPLGLPLSVMLAAHPGQDHRLLQIAQQVERNSPNMPVPQLPSDS
jgi:Asp-tRNA(Asn)/Glu-tRNA(Gln) amidotransferase A subunit family amidase